MNEKIIISAKTQNVPFGILTIIVGGIVAATCFAWETILGDWAIFTSAALGIIIALCGLVIIFKSREGGLYVTNMRVYGKTLLAVTVTASRVLQ